MDGEARVDGTNRAETELLRVAAFQFDVRRGDVAGNLRRVEEGLAEAARDGVRLVVLPEMWPSSFLDPAEMKACPVAASEEAVARLGELSAERGLVVCGSAYGATDETRKPANRLHVFDRGELVLAYDKVHLFSPTAEGETFSAGTAPPATVDTSVGRLSGIVCYDVRFGPLLRVPQRAGAELLLVPAQWPDTRAHHWRALVVGRAVEMQLFVVGANRTGRDLVGRRKLELTFPGNSLIVDPHGRALAEGNGPEGLVKADIELEAGRRMRIRVPVGKDERRDLYRDWSWSE